MDIDARVNESSKWFPMLKVIRDHLGVYIKIDTYNKDRSWTEYVRSAQSGLGGFWAMFYRGLGYVLYHRGVSMNSVCRALSVYPSQLSEDRINALPMKRGLENVDDWIDLYNGDRFIENDVMNNLQRVTDIESKDDALRWCYLFSLYGVAWYKSFPFSLGEQIVKRGMSGQEFTYELGVLYGRLDDHDREIVDMYCERWQIGGASARISILGTAAEMPSKKAIGIDQQRQGFLEVLESMKNMKDWDESDFWNEMTELYARCKGSEDVKSMKQILEMKAKTMGLLEEKDRGGVNNFLMLTEKAVVALNGMGILGRRSVVHEQ